MSRFIYIADTHLGADTMGYQQQPGYPQNLADISDVLLSLARTELEADFILHGGDLTDITDEKLVEEAAKLFTGDIPFHLCLGNHDLTTPDAAEIWLKKAGNFFGEERPDYTIRRDDCVIHVIPNHWGEFPYYWSDVQDPHFSSDQLARLEKALSEDTDLPHLMVTHSPIYGLPPAQTGLEEPFHQPSDAFVEQIEDLVKRHECLQCVLGAHNHLNMCIRRNDVWFVTASSLVEVPFECKLFDVTRERITMETISLKRHLPFGENYNFERTFVQGRAADRSFVQDLPTR